MQERYFPQLSKGEKNRNFETKSEKLMHQDYNIIEISCK